jgi:hypothetical protein
MPSRMVLLERFGERALQRYVPRNLERLAALQSHTPAQATCSGSRQVFGGWRHSARDCVQDLGYHGLIVDGLLDLYAWHKDTRTCSRVCPVLVKTLERALAWLINVQDPSSHKFHGAAPGTSSTPQNFRNAAGIIYVSRIMPALIVHAGYRPSNSIQLNFNASRVSLGDVDTRLAAAVAAEAQDLSFLGDYLSYLTTARAHGFRP